MITLRVDKSSFFDRQAVIDAVGPVVAKALSKAGAFVRRRARSSLRKRKAASTPGSPPSVHTNDQYATLRNIHFQFSRERMSVVIGPIKLNNRTGLVPGLMEHGGTVSLNDKARGVMARRLIRERDESRRGRRTKSRRKFALVEKNTIPSVIRYELRPFMGPALRAESPKFPTLFAGS